jgi:hypothetical protein
MSIDTMGSKGYYMLYVALLQSPIDSPGMVPMPSHTWNTPTHADA